MAKPSPLLRDSFQARENNFALPEPSVELDPQTNRQADPHPRMRLYRLPEDITREEFNTLVTHLYQLLAAKGLDPAAHLVIGDSKNFVNGKTRPRSALYISYTATQILLKREPK
jgi:hypothetical protein